MDARRSRANPSPARGRSRGEGRAGAYPPLRGGISSKHRIPRRRNDAIAGTILLQMTEAGERIVEALDRQFLGDDHVVDLAPGLFGLDRILIEERVPARMAGEQGRMVGHVRLDID